MDRQVDRYIDTHHAGHENKRRNLEVGGGLESGDGGDYVIGIEKLEEQVSAKVAEHTAVDRTMLEACCEKSLKIERGSQQVHVMFPEQI